jgi:hypothetical protein
MNGPLKPIKKEAKIRKAIEDKLYDLLRTKRDWKGDKEQINKEELLALSLGIKYLAVSAKLSEQEFGTGIPGLSEPGDEELENESDDDLADITKDLG